MKTRRLRNFLRVWMLYGSMFAGAVGAAVLIVVSAVFSALELLRSSAPQLSALFRGDGMLSGFEKAISNGLEYLGASIFLLFFVWILLALSAVVPATIVGLVYEVLNKYLRFKKVVLTITYCLAALFSAAYGVAAMGAQHDGMPFIYVPLALATGLIACNITLRFRGDVFEPEHMLNTPAAQRRSTL